MCTMCLFLDTRNQPTKAPPTSKPDVGNHVTGAAIAGIVIGVILIIAFGIAGFYVVLKLTPQRSLFANKSSGHQVFENPMTTQVEMPGDMQVTMEAVNDEKVSKKISNGTSDA